MLGSDRRHAEHMVELVVSSDTDFPVSYIHAANVSHVQQRSPLRYPGGKTWLVPHIRAWLAALPSKPKLLVEPFCGGGIISLTAASEGLVERCLMVELDRDVAAFWQAALRHNSEMCELVADFEPTVEAVERIAETDPGNLVENGFRTLVLNRTKRGGILAPGAAFVKKGDGGGVASRWYPDTLIRRLRSIESVSDRLVFCCGDGMELLDITMDSSESVVFADPPYTAGGKSAGSRLYSHSDIDHARLFRILAEQQSEFVLTYDNSPEVAEMIAEHGFHAARVSMKNAHHDLISELVITRDDTFSEAGGWETLPLGSANRP